MISHLFLSGFYKMSQKVTNLCVAVHSAILTYKKHAPVYLIISVLTFEPF